MTATPAFSLDNLESFEGSERGVSDWLEITQTQIDEFAHCTGDLQWIHVDVERAVRESPFGSTIAHGYLVLSLLGKFLQDVDTFPDGASQALNYGLDKVRFMAPVKPGDRVRARVVLSRVEDKGSGRKLQHLNCTIEIDGGDKPALIAETLVMLLP